MEELPKTIEYPKLKSAPFWRNKIFVIVILVILLSSFFGFAAGIIGANLLGDEFKDILSKLNIQLSGQEKKIDGVYSPETSQEESTINVVREASPAVVSIIVTKNLPVIEQYYINPFPDSPFNFLIPQYRQKGFQEQEVGGGTGFIISEDGMILTNEHVVSDIEADYTVLTNDGKKYSAEVLARDSIRDLAVIKISKLDSATSAEIKEPDRSFSTLKLGDSDNLQIGQTIIAIGNALGEFRNTISVGVISGLGRTVTAGSGDTVETQEDVIQTDAAINPGNSGGPLLNLKGEVIGVNFAMAQGAENIGFAIPINRAKKDIEQVKTIGKISYPFLGVIYVVLNDTIQKENNLPVNYGAWIIKGSQGEAAITAGSPAEKAGLKEGDIILELGGEKITADNGLTKIISKYNPEDRIALKFLRNGQESTIEVTLAELEQ